MLKAIFGGQNRKYVIFSITALALLMSSANSTIVATALPTIQHSLKADLSWTAWIITAYQLMTLIMLPVMGRISDQWGRKRVLIVCVAIFTTSSFLCALSTNIYMLILFRFLQALGGSGFMPTSMGIVGDYFKENRARAIGLFTTIFPLGGIIGPAFGGLILDFAPWQAIFLINIPAGLMVLAMTYLLLEPDTRVNRTRLDITGISFLAATMLCLMFFLTRISENPLSAYSWLTWAILLAGALLLWAFLRWENMSASPVLELTLLKNRTFIIINGLNLLYGACVFGLMAFIPYYGRVAYGLSNLASGGMLTARALGMMVMSVLTSMLLNRLGYRIPMAVGFLVLAVSVLALSFSQHPVILGLAIPDFWWLALVIFISGMGVGMASPSSNNAAIELMPDKIAEISGLRGMFRQAGGVIGTSLIVLVLSRFQDKAEGFHVIFGAMFIILIAAAPLIREVPNGRRKAA
ncbi:MFS transporter [Desulfoscipio sp. XC116]|uniref:MFS transporter n=1 Tax=Desulfoscipio sp. XC116 TaxID=3144975 RepID=UPI00325A51EC